jgi:hypothetical protein
MKKKFFWTAFIIIILVAGVLSWHLLSPYKKADMLCAIPPKPVFIIETDNSYDAWEKLTKSEVWEHLRKHQVFAKVAAGMDMIDTIVQSNEKLAEYIGNRNILISMHMIGNNAYDFVYIVDLRRVSKLVTFEKFLKGFLSDNYEVKDYPHHEETVYKLTDHKSLSTVYLCFLNNLLVASFNSKLLEASIDQFDNPELAKDKNFLTIYDKLKGEGMFRIFLNYAQLDEYTNGMLSSPDQNIKQLSKSLLYTGLAFKIDHNNLIRCDGYTNFNDTIVSSFRAMINSGNGKTNLADVLPAQTASSVSLGFDRFTEYFDNLMSNLKEVPKNYNEYQATIKKAEDFLKIDVRKNIMSWIGDEIAMVHLPPMGLGRSNEFAVFLRARDIDDAKENLNFVMAQVKKRSPAKFDAIEYKGYNINYLSIKGFFKLLFGKYFQKLERPYFTYIGDYVVFSNHPQTLKVIIDGFVNKSLLINSEEYKSFASNFSRHSNVLVLINTSQFLKGLQGTINPSTYAGLESNKEYIVSFPYMGFQLEKDGSLFKTRFYVQFKKETEALAENPMNGIAEDASDTLSAEVSDQTKEEVTSILAKVDEYIPDDLTKSVYIEKYSNGKVKVEFELKDGFRHGEYKEYYDNGEPKIKGHYKRDHKEGTWKIYAENGKLLQKVKFDDGKRKD